MQRMIVLAPDMKAMDEALEVHKEVKMIEVVEEETGEMRATLEMAHIMTAYHFGKYLQLCEMINKSEAEREI